MEILKPCLIHRDLLPFFEFFHGNLSHAEFLQLAGNGHRKRVDKIDQFRYFEMRQLVLAEILNFVGGAIGIGMQLNPGGDFLAVKIVRAP